MPDDVLGKPHDSAEGEEEDIFAPLWSEALRITTGIVGVSMLMGAMFAVFGIHPFYTFIKP